MATISIITVNLNNNRGLKKTIESIIAQTNISYEHIIIDGGSIDGSTETIIEYSNTSPQLAYWISEKDNGIYNAMNKGIHYASGDYLLFLNSGDFLEPNILNLLKDQITGEDIIYGDLYFVSQNGERRLQTFNYPNLSATRVLLPSFCIPHPATIIKRSLFKEEQYNEHYKIISDWEFFVRNIILKDCTTKHIPLGISNFIDGGISSIEENKNLIIKERQDALSNLFSPKIIESLNKLMVIEQSPLCETILKTNHTNRFQRKMKKVILLCYKIYCLFTHHN